MDRKLRVSLLIVAVALFIGACDLSFFNSQADVEKRVQQTVAAKTTLDAAVKATVDAQAEARATATNPPPPPPTFPPAPSPLPLPTATPLVAPSPIAPPTLAATNTPTRAPTATQPPTPAAPARRLANGTRISGDPRGGGGESYITVTNNQDLDAVFVMVDNGMKIPVQVAYVRSKESFKLENIQVGDYTFYYVLGEDWDNTALQFTRKAEYHRFTDVMKFERILNPATGGGTYTYWTMPILVGNVEPRLPVITANQFPSLK